MDVLFRDAPLGLFALMLFLALVLAREFGAWAHRLVSGQKTTAESSDEGYILSAVLGLLALLLAFTFGLALNHYEKRRELVVTEANALGTAYLRADLLDQPEQLKSLMRAYTQERLAYGHSAGAAADTVAARAEQLQTRIWTMASTAVRPLRTTPMAPMLLQPLNEAFDAAAARRAALAARLPASVVAALSLYMIVAAGMLGYTVAAAGGRHRIASMVLFLLLTLAMDLILDLDRPRNGAIHISQAAMADTLSAMGGPEVR